MAFRMIIDVWGVRSEEDETTIKEYIEREATKIVEGPDGAKCEFSYEAQEEP